MAGLMSRASMVVKAKFSKLLDHAENPAETLDYSYERQLELLQNVKRGIADVVTSKKRLELQEEQLVASEKALSAKVEAFRTQKETIKAQYSAAEAQVRIGEAATGIGEQMADTGFAIQRAKDKTEQMQARASAIDELTESGALEDFTSSSDALDRELGQLSQQSQVDKELEAMKAQVGAGEPQKELSSETSKEAAE